MCHLSFNSSLKFNKVLSSHIHSLFLYILVSLELQIIMHKMINMRYI